METVKSAMTRPISGRPLTSGRAMTNTGLIAPKSSRGKTALRRQVQDKSYFIGLLRSKINEINAEKMALLRECEIMSKEEARIGVYRQKAETLAKELNELTLDLMTHNEYLDRARIGDQADAIKEDTNKVKHDNEALIANLEHDYSKLRELAVSYKKYEEEQQEIQKEINAVKNKFSESQRSEFNMMQSMSNELSKECHQLESEIAIWRSKKSEVENKTIKEGNLLKMELLQAISKFHHLEKQKSELVNVDSSEENERGHLLAQVKRDNNFITSLELKIAQLNKHLVDLQSEAEFYKDGDKVLKFADLRQKEKVFDDFLVKYNAEKEGFLSKIESVNNEINDITNKLSRCLKYSNALKQITDEANGNYDMTHELIIQKRKLEIELYKNQQIRQRAENEKENLTSKISKLQESAESYSDVARLKSQIEAKLEETKHNCNKVKQEIEELRLKNENIKSEIREIRLGMDRDPFYQEISKLEGNLRDILRINEKLKANDSSQMMSEIKTVVLDNVKKYNQNLLGF